MTLVEIVKKYGLGVRVKAPNHPLFEIIEDDGDTYLVKYKDAYANIHKYSLCMDDYELLSAPIRIVEVVSKCVVEPMTDDILHNPGAISDGLNKAAEKTDETVRYICGDDKKDKKE